MFNLLTLTWLEISRLVLGLLGLLASLCLLRVAINYVTCLLWIALVCFASFRRLVEFLAFNSLTLVCLELAMLVLFLGLLACYTLIWFGCFSCFFVHFAVLACLLCFALLAWFALLA